MKPPRRLATAKLVKSVMKGCSHPEKGRVRLLKVAERPGRRRFFVADAWCSACGALHYISGRWRKPRDFFAIAAATGLVGGLALLAALGNPKAKPSGPGLLFGRAKKGRRK